MTRLKVEALHIGDSLVDPTDGAWVADGSLGPFLGVQMHAKNASDPNLTKIELLRALAVACLDVEVCGGKDLDKVLTNEALTIGERLGIGVAIEA